MEIGLRILAFLIDTVLCIASMVGVVLLLMMLLALGLQAQPQGTTDPVLQMFQVASLFAVVGSTLVFPIAMVLWPFLYFALPTAIWGRTPGRWICRLRVTIGDDHPAGFWRGLGRETLKTLGTWLIGIGGIIALLQLLTTGTTWYDQLCQTTVEHKPYVRLTSTQKAFRRAAPATRRGL